MSFWMLSASLSSVQRFLMEEVFKVHGEETITKQKTTLIKFLVIIIIAVSLEALAFFFCSKKRYQPTDVPHFFTIDCGNVGNRF